MKKQSIFVFACGVFFAGCLSVENNSDKIYSDTINDIQQHHETKAQPEMGALWEELAKEPFEQNATWEYQVETPPNEAGLSAIETTQIMAIKNNIGIKTLHIDYTINMQNEDDYYDDSDEALVLVSAIYDVETKNYTFVGGLDRIGFVQAIIDQNETATELEKRNAIGQHIEAMTSYLQAEKSNFMQAPVASIRYEFDFSDTANFFSDINDFE